jgi:hypothetical protein
MMICRLCGLTIDKIPDDAIQCGKLYRFTNGEYHYLRKKPEPRIGPRPRKHRNPDQQAPQEPITVPPAPPIMGRGAHNVPAAPLEKTVEPERVPAEEVPGETTMEKAFRVGLAKVKV